jgi:hypothetical protein
MTINHRFAQIIVRAWEDLDFRQRLLERPHEAFAEFGIQAPEGVTIKVLADDPSVQHFVLPMKPAPVIEVELDA